MPEELPFKRLVVKSRDPLALHYTNLLNEKNLYKAIAYLQTKKFSKC